MRQIFIAWIFTLSQVALATTAYDVRDGKQMSSQAFNENYIKNGTFEQNNENAITDASAIAAISATTPISGTYSLGIDATTSGQLVKMQGRTISQVGGQCEAVFYYSGDASLYKAYVLQSSTKVSSEVTLLNVSTNVQKASLPFPCGAGTAPDVTIEATSNSAAAIKVDDVYAGMPLNIGTVAQASFVGSLKYAGVTSCQWSTASTSFAAFAADTDCSTPTVTGSATAPGTKIPGVVFSNLAPGTYRVVANFGIGKTGTQDAVVSMALNDGTTTSAGKTFYNGTANGTVVAPATVEGYFTYTTAQSSVTFQVYGYSQNASNNALIEMGNTNRDFEIAVEYFPSAAQTVVRMDQVGWYVDATMDGANPNLGLSNVSSYTELTDASLTLKPQSGSAAVGVMCSSTNAATSPSTSNTTCAAGSESVGINFNIPLPGAYEVCWYGAHYGVVDTSESISAAFQLIETPTNAQTLTLEGGTRQVTSVGGMNIATGLSQSRTAPISNCSVFNWASTGTKGVRVMYEQAVAGTPNTSIILADSDSATGQRNMRFTVKPVTQAMNMPLLVGGVTSNTTGMERVERARLQISGASTCSVISESGDWLGTCTASGSDATIPINSGIFSSAPSCAGIGRGSANAFVRYGGTMPTTSSLSITHRDTSNAASTAEFDVICMGPR